MTYNLMTPDSTALTLPITSRALEVAQQFAQQQPTPAKRERVSLNTLAVCTVNNYLEMMGFATNLQGGDSWNPIARMGANVADLEVNGIGKLECIPVQTEDTEYAIPAEVWLDRVGYLFVEINLAEREATIRGFVPQARAIVSRDRLRSPEDLIDRLHGLMTTPLVRLDRWLDGLEETIATGWQSIESLFTTPELAFRSVGTPTRPDVIQRGKVIDLGIQLLGHPIALVVELSPTADEERTQIRLRVCPINQTYLRSNIQLIVLDDSHQTFLEAQSRTDDSLIQLEFTGTPGEKFGVVVKLGSAEVMEQFTI
jgi:Protein of unknown function (DUF1822)